MGRLGSKAIRGCRGAGLLTTITPETPCQDTNATSVLATCPPNIVMRLMVS
jgi:hypothetical protein